MHWELEGTDPARLAVTPEKERGATRVLAGKGSAGGDESVSTQMRSSCAHSTEGTRGPGA